MKEDFINVTSIIKALDDENNNEFIDNDIDIYNTSYIYNYNEI